MIDSCYPLLWAAMGPSRPVSCFFWVVCLDIKTVQDSFATVDENVLMSLYTFCKHELYSRHIHLTRYCTHSVVPLGPWIFSISLKSVM